MERNAQQTHYLSHCYSISTAQVNYLFNNKGQYHEYMEEALFYHKCNSTKYDEVKYTIVFLLLN